MSGGLKIVLLLMLSTICPSQANEQEPASLFKKFDREEYCKLLSGVAEGNLKALIDGTDYMEMRENILIHGEGINQSDRQLMALLLREAADYFTSDDFRRYPRSQAFNRFKTQVAISCDDGRY